jgi:hypothetical protein
MNMPPEIKAKLEKWGKEAKPINHMLGDAANARVLGVVDDVSGIKLLTPIVIAIPYASLLQTAGHILVSTPMMAGAARAVTRAD